MASTGMLVLPVVPVVEELTRSLVVRKLLVRGAPAARAHRIAVVVQWVPVVAEKLLSEQMRQVELRPVVGTVVQDNYTLVLIMLVAVVVVKITVLVAQRGLADQVLAATDHLPQEQMVQQTQVPAAAGVVLHRVTVQQVSS